MYRRNSMRKRSLWLAIVLMLAFVLTACGGGNNAVNNAAVNENNAANNVANNAEEEPADEASDLKVGFVTDEGGINDQSFNQGVWEGIELASEELGVTSEYQESKDSNDYAPNLETVVDNGNDLIIAAGFNLGEAIYESAQMNPDVKYAIIDYAYDEPLDNLVGIVFKAEEPSFLVGYIAGLTTETDKVGFVGGQESTVISAFENGYKAGVAQAAKELDKEIEVTTQYVGNFTDASKGKSIALNMYQQDNDIIFHASGGAGDGVIEAAKENDKWAIGVDRDQSHLAPDNVLTSAMKRVDVAAYDMIEILANGDDFPGGETVVYGLAEGEGVGIAPTSEDNVAPDVLEKANAMQERIASGEIVVPATDEDFEAFIAE